MLFFLRIGSNLQRFQPTALRTRNRDAANAAQMFTLAADPLSGCVGPVLQLKRHGLWSLILANPDESYHDISNT
jgi:hypothetical protein